MQVNLEMSLESAFKILKRIDRKLYGPLQEVYDSVLRKYVETRANLHYTLSQTEVNTVLEVVKSLSSTKEVALEPFVHSYGWGIKVLKIIQQPPGLLPEVEEILSVSGSAFPKGCTLKTLWESINTKSNLIALKYAQREELRDPDYYEY